MTRITLPTDTALEALAAVERALLVLDAHTTDFAGERIENGRWTGDETSAREYADLTAAEADLDRVREQLQSAIDGDASIEVDDEDYCSGLGGSGPDGAWTTKDFMPTLTAQQADQLRALERQQQILDAGRFVIESHVESIITSDGRRIQIAGDPTLGREVADAWAKSRETTNDTA